MALIDDKKIDPLIITFIGMFQDERYGYKVLMSSVVVNIFYSLYNRLIQVDVKPIEIISIDEKTKYWNIAKRFYTTEEEAIRCSKAAYVLCLICNY